MFAKNEKNESKTMQPNSFSKLDLISKLRVVIFSVLGLSTLGFLLIFVNVWALAAFFILISYVMIIVLAIKLLIVKKL